MTDQQGEAPRGPLPPPQLNHEPVTEVVPPPGYRAVIRDGRMSFEPDRTVEEAIEASPEMVAEVGSPRLARTKEELLAGVHGSTPPFIEYGEGGVGPRGDESWLQMDPADRELFRQRAVIEQRMLAEGQAEAIVEPSAAELNGDSPPDRDSMVGNRAAEYVKAGYSWPEAAASAERDVDAYLASLPQAEPAAVQRDVVAGLPPAEQDALLDGEPDRPLFAREVEGSPGWFQPDPTPAPLEVEPPAPAAAAGVSLEMVLSAVLGLAENYTAHAQLIEGIARERQADRQRIDALATHLGLTFREQG